MFQITYLLLVLVLFSPSLLKAKEMAVAQKTEAKTTLYKYADRTDHTVSETTSHLGFLYAFSWGLYYVTQPDTISDNGSSQNYKKNFGKTVLYDRDRSVWNWMVHPFSGSQTYLYYRAAGYKRPEAFKLTFLQSALFEYTAEILTEPASFEDLFNTPVLGSTLGVFLEGVTMDFINNGSPVLKVIGHVLNPATLLFFYEGRIRVTPKVSEKTFSQAKTLGLSVSVDL